MFSKKKHIRMFVCILLCICTLLGDIPCNLSLVYADESSATERVTNFINLAAGKKVQDLSSGTELTKDELRFLGVYLSNFFIPFGTEFGVTSEEATEQSKTDIINALKTGLNFSDEMSSILTEEIMGLSRNNSQELEFRVSNEYQSGYQEVPNFKLNYYNFLAFMTGNSTAIFRGYPESKSYEKIHGELATGSINYGYFGYNKGGKFIPVFDCSMNGKYFTPSQLAFLQCLASVDVENGYGTSFFDFTKTESGDEDDLSEKIGSMSDSAIYKMSIYGTTINVDCFGNIILKGANHQYVAVPGCMNPYTWVAVGTDGNDSQKPGECYNMVSFQGLGLADTDGLIKGKPSVEESKGGTSDSDSDGSLSSDGTIKWVTPNLGKIKNTLLSIQEDYTSLVGDVKNWLEGDTIADWVADWTAKAVGNEDRRAIYDGSLKGLVLRTVRGDSTVKLTEGIFKTKTKYLDLLTKAEKGFIDENPKDKSYYLASRGGLAETGAFDEGANERFAILGNYSDFLYYTGKRAVERDNGKKGNQIKLIDNFIYIDQLGAFHFDNSDEQISYNALQSSHYLDEDGKSPKKLFESWGNDSNNGYTNMFKDIQAGKMASVSADQTAIVSTYTSYAMAGLYKDDSASKQATIGWLGFRINIDNMLDIDNSPISIPEDLLDDMLEDSIKNWTYYLLHPKEGANYFRILVKNKVSSLLVGWHNDMVGTEGVGVTTGTTRYKNSTGYVTTPDLGEISWTNKMVGYFRDAIPFLIVIVVVIMLFTYFLNIMSFQRCIIGVLIFSITIFMPLTLVNNAVSIGNRVSQGVYSEKLTYWALVQQETYANALDEAASGDSYSNYLRTLYATNSEVYQNQGGDSILLKWQAPKKMASLMLSSEDATRLDGLQDSSLIGKVLNSNAFSGETYLDGDNDYLYRSYTDLGNFSRFIYNGISQGTRECDGSPNIRNTKYMDKSYIASAKTLDKDFALDRSMGYSNTNGDGSSDYSKALRVSAPYSRMYADSLSQRNKVADLGTKDFVGIRQDTFNFSVAMFNNSSLDFKTTLSANAEGNCKDDLEAYLDKYTDKDLTGLAAYSLMSESPFYYFSWGLYDMGMCTSAGAMGNYKNILLKQGDGGFFYNVKEGSNGELKDFMDMKSLFTYVIPYLREGNDLVREWDSIYGTKIYEGVPTEEGHWDDAEIKESKVLQQKYWHNLNVARLYSIYTPWVDLMYDASYADPETIKVLGEDFTVSDPLNPAYYPEERPMVFSESEMHDYGLTRGDLTEVERKILDVNRGMQERMYNLLNYFNFSDLSLNTAAALNCTFEFNTNFSEGGIFSNNINLYPQSFEISDFSYDAFLRFILANSTGESLAESGDFYENIVKLSSLTTAIVMLVLDILSQYALPACKIFFLVLSVVFAILIVLVTLFKLGTERRYLVKMLKDLIVPILYYMGINIGFSLLISLFMGEGNTQVIGSESVSLGDPTTVMLAMIAITIVCIILYVKLIFQMLKCVKDSAGLVGSFALGVVGGALGNFAKCVGGRVLGLGGKLGHLATGALGRVGIGAVKTVGKAFRRRGTNDEPDYSSSNDEETFDSNASPRAMNRSNQEPYNPFSNNEEPQNTRTRDAYQDSMRNTTSENNPDVSETSRSIDDLANRGMENILESSTEPYNPFSNNEVDESERRRHEATSNY